MELLDRYLKDLCIVGLLHQRKVAVSYSLVASYLQEDAELGMDIRERPGPDLGANAVQVEELFLAGKFLDLIAQEQHVDAGENGAVSYGGAPRDTGVDQAKAEYTPTLPDEEQHLARGNPGRPWLERLPVASG